jgi:class 3 adenylate cyclase
VREPIDIAFARNVATVLFTDIVDSTSQAAALGNRRWRELRDARAICDAVGWIGVEVRAGLHTGEIELDGDDIAGVAVAIGARSARWPEPGRCSRRRRCRTSPSGRGSASTTGATTS